MGFLGPCAHGLAVLNVTGEFDYVVTMEDLSKGQRIGNYSIDFRREGSDEWEVLVPAVQPAPTPPRASSTRAGSKGVGTDHTEAAAGWRIKGADRPDGHDPRDQYIGHKRIDTTAVPMSGAKAVHAAQVRFNCLALVASAGEASAGEGAHVYLRKLSLHKKLVPWRE